MIRYRLINNNDIEKVAEYCINQNIDPPRDLFAGIIAEDENGEIKGFSALRSEIRIEPMISDNPLIANNLYNQLLGVCLANGVKNLYAHTNQEDKAELYNKFGFKQLENTLILRKEL